MKVIELNGEDRRLYDLVAHLVMNEEVLKYNLNYPFRTSAEYRWFVAVDESATLGFIPVKLHKEKATVNNYYIAGDDSAVLSSLLKKVVKTLSPHWTIESITQLRHIPVFEQNGFAVGLRWKKYVKMKFCGR